MKQLRLLFLSGLALLLSGCKLAILDPKGLIAATEKQILVDATLLMLIVVVPVIILSFVFAYRYRANNTKAKYTPNWSHNTALEVVWWTIPCIIIAILAAITWISTHKLDPYRPLDMKTKPITIQAIALDWRWLFIYPEQNIATVNYLEIPAHVPIQFLITADAPMNSFQIPQLAGQIYAMTGMQTKLYLVASTPGQYTGLSTNFSGDGFSRMHFVVRVTTQSQFEQWVNEAKFGQKQLSLQAYNALAKPSEDTNVYYFSPVEGNLFKTVIGKYMKPVQKTTSEGNQHA